MTKREARLQLATDKRTWYVMILEQPHYSLVPVPAGGKFGCTIIQTVNGRRFDVQGTFAKPEEALRAGLEELRKILGW
jgi:hypothetical protein